MAARRLAAKKNLLSNEQDMTSPAAPFRSSVPRVFPPDVTTYDVLKSLAIILMVADHIGYYFFPDYFWWRVFGRLCVPIWLFLIGYARSRTIDRQLLGGALLLVAVNAALGMDILPVNILWTILLVRLGIDPVMRWINHSIDRLFMVTMAALVLFPLTNAITEYGTLALILAIAGHIARNGFGNPQQKMNVIYGGIAGLLYAGTQFLAFPFDIFQSAGLFAGTGLAMASLLVYLPQQTTRISHPFATSILHFLGRHTLLIYVVHLVIFKLAWLSLCPCIRHCCCHPPPIDFTMLMR
jgi:hypothetical protein